MPRYEESKSRDTQIIPKQVREISRGNSRTTGEPWVMWQVIATKPDGTPIEKNGEPLNLRTFDELPLNEVVNVTVTPFTSEQFGTSYTLKIKGQTKQQKEMAELRERVRRIEERLGLSSEVAGAPKPPPPPSTATPPMPPAPAQSAAGGDDIPF
jgi:hypothetical protein